MEQKIDQKVLVNHALKNGAILGVIGIVLTILMYILDVSFFASLWTLFIFIVINVGFTIYSSIAFRKDMGGYLSFKFTFLHGLIILFLASVISRVFMLVLFNVIDPGLAQTVTDISIEKWTALMEGWNTPQDKMEEAIDKMKTDLPKSFSSLGILISIFWPGFVINAVVACITGAIAKKNEPEAV